MSKYRKKPVVIDAIQWTGKNYEEVINFTADVPHIFKLPSEKAFSIPTSEGIMKAEVGDYIIREPFPTSDRTYYPCKPDIFEKTYEKEE